MTIDLGRPAILSMEMQRGVVGDRSRIRPLIEAVDAVGLIPNLAGMMRRARAAGITVVMDRCPLIETRRLGLPPLA